MMFWTGDSWGWGGWLLMAVSMIAFWGLLAWLALALVRSTSPRAGERHSTPEDLLADRFARGQIDTDEFQRRAAILREERAHKTT